MSKETLFLFLVSKYFASYYRPTRFLKSRPSQLDFKTRKFQKSLNLNQSGGGPVFTEQESLDAFTK